MMEFGLFESSALEYALAAVVGDPIVLETIQAVMVNSEDRFKLLQKIAERRRMPAALIKELKTVLKEARDLREIRNIVAHNMCVDDVPPGLHALGVRRPPLEEA